MVVGSTGASLVGGLALDEYFILSYDAREQAWDRGSRWSDEFQFGDRAYFELGRGPASLVVEDVRAEEAGVYGCRVDFKSAPTRNTLVNLTLIGESMGGLVGWQRFLKPPVGYDLCGQVFQFHVYFFCV